MMEKTPLHHASGKGFSSIVELLSSHGADINIEDKNGWTALHFAGGNGHLGTVKFLMSQGAEISREDKAGWRPIDHCISFWSP